MDSLNTFNFVTFVEILMLYDMNLNIGNLFVDSLFIYFNNFEFILYRYILTT